MSKKKISKTSFLSAKQTSNSVSPSTAVPLTKAYPDWVSVLVWLCINSKEGIALLCKELPAKHSIPSILTVCSMGHPCVWNGDVDPIEAQYPIHLGCCVKDGKIAAAKKWLADYITAYEEDNLQDPQHYKWEASVKRTLKQVQELYDEYGKCISLQQMPIPKVRFYTILMKCALLGDVQLSVPEGKAIYINQVIENLQLTLIKDLPEIEKNLIPPSADYEYMGLRLYAQEGIIRYGSRQVQRFRVTNNNAFTLLVRMMNKRRGSPSLAELRKLFQVDTWLNDDAFRHRVESYINTVNKRMEEVGFPKELHIMAKTVEWQKRLK